MAPAVPAAPATAADELAAAASALHRDAGSLHDRQTAADGLASLLASINGGILNGSGPSMADTVTPAGLPQRTAGTSRRPSQQQAATPAEPPAKPVRSADDVRSMLSRFRTGVERGRQLPDPTTSAANTPEDRP